MPAVRAASRPAARRGPPAAGRPGPARRPARAGSSAAAATSRPPRARATASARSNPLRSCAASPASSASDHPLVRPVRRSSPPPPGSGPGTPAARRPAGRQVSPGSPPAMSASISTRCPSTPRSATDQCPGQRHQNAARSAAARGPARRAGAPRPRRSAARASRTWCAASQRLRQPADPAPTCAASTASAGSPNRGAGPGLHLAEDQRCAVHGDDVELALAAPPVARRDQQPASLQVARRHVLAAAAERVLRCHAVHDRAAGRAADRLGQLCGRPTRMGTDRPRRPGAACRTKVVRRSADVSDQPNGPSPRQLAGRACPAPRR